MTADETLRVLGELAQLGMDVVRRVHQAAMTAEDAAAQAALAEAFCDVGRGVRQTIALSVRIENGGFAPSRAAPRVDALSEAASEPLDADADEAADRPERTDWNEYERPDYGTPLRLTGDAAADEEIVRTAVQAAVIRIRRTCDRGLAVLARVEARPTARGAMLAGSALSGSGLQGLDDSS